MESTSPVIINEHPQQFEIIVDGEKGYLVYRYHNNDLVLMHTFVPESLRGKGIAARLAKFALEFAKQKNIKVVVYCPFVAAYLKKHPEYNYLVRFQE
jgi:predicted GNAT family acetyltransferase